MPIIGTSEILPVSLKLDACLVSTGGNCLVCSRAIAAGKMATLNREAQRIICWDCTGKAIAKQVEEERKGKIII